MKTKESVFIGICVLLSGMLFAQEPLIFVAANDTTAYSTDGNGEIELHTGEHIILDNRVVITFSYITYNNPQAEYHIKFNFTDPKSNKRYSVLAKDFLPINTEDKFGGDIFIDYPPDIFDPQYGEGDLLLRIGDVDEMWVPDYYCDVLARKNRDKILEIHPGLSGLNDVRAGNRYIWYDNTTADIQNGRVMFYNSVIKLGIQTHFAVRNIKRTTYGYSVDCVESTWNDRSYVTSFTNSVFWNRYKPGDAMTLYIYLDGDYMDIYVDGNDILLGTFVKVKREFIKQYQSLIKANTCDLTNVQWPKRADGSMDYSIPTLNTSEEVRQHESTEFSVGSDDIKNQLAIQNGAKTNAMPLWAWVAIIGGAVLIAGGAAVFVIKRRK